MSKRKMKDRPDQSTVAGSGSISRDIEYGRTTYPGGRIINISSRHMEWLDWAVKVLDEAAKQEKKP